jgi:hypothetical protein
MLPERDQQTIDLYPILPREHGFESGHSAFWSPRLDIAPAIGHPMDMNVDADVWLMAGNA